MINTYKNTKFDLTKTLIPKAYILIQKIFFSFGYKWSYDIQDIKEFPFKYIFIYAHNAMMTIGDNESIFRQDSKKELNLDDFIAEQQYDNVKKIIADHFAAYKSDHFVLPEKWYIEINEENRESIEKWAGWKLNDKYFLEGAIVGYDKFWIPRKRFSNQGLNKFKEISFEQFQQHVIKKIPTKQFTLPNEWCVEVTQDSRQVLSDFRKSISRNKYSIAGVGGFIAKTGCHYLDKPLYMTEITFEQFMEHVWSKPVEKTFILPNEKNTTKPVNEWESGDVIIRKIGCPHYVLKEGKSYMISDVINHYGGSISIRIVGIEWMFDSDKFTFGHRPTIETWDGIGSVIQEYIPDISERYSYLNEVQKNKTIKHEEKIEGNALKLPRSYSTITRGS